MRLEELITMKGGARVNSGPPPDPNALRRDRASDRNGWTVLPEEGYSGAIPEWPLIPDVTAEANRDFALKCAEDLVDELAEAEDARTRAALKKKLETANRTVTVLDRQIEAQKELEQTLWNDLWRTPQAVVWFSLGWTRDVAQYARHKTRAELGSLDDAKEARQWSDRLGLNPAAMLRNRWKIGPAAAPAPATKPTPAKRSSSRSRLTVVDGEGA
jgi:hypothetical protein